LPAHHRAVIKPILILMICATIANTLASLHSEPPLLIDSKPSPAAITSFDESR
jgi:hypothetical protein